MATVRTIRPDVRAVECPAPLRNLDAFLIWRYEQHQGEPKARKVPYYQSGTRRRGKQGDPADRAQLTTFAAARDAAVRKGFDGVGFALMPEWGVTALDFDNCIADDGSLPSEIETITARTYAERSPSGKGIRAFVKGDLGNRKSPSTPEQWGLETFYSTGFVTITGDVLDATDILGLQDTIATVDDHVTRMCSKRFAASSTIRDPDDFTAGYEPILNLAESEIRAALDVLDPGVGREDWIAIGMALHHQHHGDEDGFQLWDEWSSGGATYPGEEGLRTQWDSFTRRAGPGQRQVTMASVLKMAKDATREADSALATVSGAEAYAERLAAENPQSVLPATAPDYKGKYQVTQAADMVARKPIEWFIKGVLPKAELGMLFGASTAGKSFVALDWAMSIARGIEWRGHRVRQAKVIIIAAEGAGGYGKRIKAYCQTHGVDPREIPIGILADAPNLLDAEDVNEIVAAVRAAGGCDILFIDTLAQVTPGSNENSSEDGGRAIAHARVIHQATGAMVIPIHHTGKDTDRGARGWSGWKGALDVEIEVSRDESDDSREIRVSKMKDEEDGARFGFKLGIVTVGMDEDGDELRSCVVTEDAVRARERVKPKGGKPLAERSAWEDLLLEAAYASGKAVMQERALVDAAVALAPPWQGDGCDRRRVNMMAALASLRRQKPPPLVVKGGIVSIL